MFDSLPTKENAILTLMRLFSLAFFPVARTPNMAPHLRALASCLVASRLIVLTGCMILPAFTFSGILGTAHAQSADDAEAEQDAMDAQKQAETRKEARRAAPPSALPGAESPEDDDPSHARLDVDPTAALFDAINRGSLNSAKEALNRGADINAHNMLDQTPLDMAIDLGRNNIMFLLLSLRTYNSDGRFYGDVDHGDITDQGNGSSHITINGKAGISATAPKKSAIMVDGGKAVPDIGFLGFGAATMPAHTMTNPVHYPYAQAHKQELQERTRTVPTAP